METITKEQVRAFMNESVEDEDEVIEKVFGDREFSTDAELFNALKEKGWEYFAHYSLTKTVFGWVYMPDLDEDEKAIYDHFMEK